MTDITLIDTTKTWVGTTAPPYPPFAVLSVAGYLEKSGFKVSVFDNKFENYKKIKINSTMAIGITAMTGRQIYFGLEIAKFIREKDSDIPIIWGGVHPSLLPEQTLKNPYVDIVVRGEGEITAKELMQKISKGKSLKNVKGISYKYKGKIIHNPERPFMNMDETSDMPLHLLENLDKYNPKEVIYYLSSRGCPHRCNYCYNQSFSKRYWRTKSVKKILEELRWLIEKFHPKSIDFIEDNFFVNQDRVKEICQGLLDMGFDGKWNADCRIDYFKRFDESFMNLLEKSGCNGLFFGVESGSQKILDFIHKDTRVEEIIPAIKKCKEHNIKSVDAFMIGFPTETKKEVYETINIIDKILEIDKDAVTLVNMLSPYPGTEMFNLALKYGFEPPKSFEEWGGDWTYSSGKNIFWFDKKYKNFLETIHIVSKMRNKFTISTSSLQSFFNSMLKAPLAFSANMRWRYKFFNFPIEWEIYPHIQKWRGYA